MPVVRIMVRHFISSSGDLYIILHIIPKYMPLPWPFLFLDGDDPEFERSHNPTRVLGDPIWKMSMILLGFGGSQGCVVLSTGLSCQDLPGPDRTDMNTLQSTEHLQAVENTDMDRPRYFFNFKLHIHKLREFCRALRTIYELSP